MAHSKAKINRFVAGCFFRTCRLLPARWRGTIVDNSRENQTMKLMMLGVALLAHAPANRFRPPVPGLAPFPFRLHPDHARGADLPATATEVELPPARATG